MGEKLNPRPLDSTSCPAHPSESIVGMCGCGTFFCRLCSPSAVFCDSCYQKHQQLNVQSQAAVLTRPAYPQAASIGDTRVARPLSRRLLIDSLLTFILASVVIAGAFGLQSRSITASTNQALISFGINVSKEPLQNGTAPFDTTIALDDSMVTLTSDASYSINAKVESIKPYNDALGEIVPYDVLLAWGDMAEDDVDSKLAWNQSDRKGTVSGSLGGPGGADVSSEYVINHVSNNHIVPATARIRNALENIEPGDTVRIEGRLVDVRMLTDDNRILSISSSKTRTDQGEGACEVIYVERIRVNDQSYF